MKNATEQQAVKLAAVVVEHNGLFTRGAPEDVQWAIQNGADAVGLFLSALKNRVKEVVKRVVKFIALPTVTSNGMDGKKAIARLESKKFRVGDWAKDVMKVGKDVQGNLAFTTTTGVTYKPVVIKGEEFTDAERVTSNIRKVADELHLVTPPAELTSLLREALSDEDIEKMGLVWLVVMHEPITASDGNSHLLGLRRSGGGRWLSAYWDEPDCGWARQCGFVFLAPQD